ncbi:MAG TPA: S8 family serine peptidase, partial [Pseudothermotoga sp.]|nr:S8 family serine peptidase [Pseudothermotoga sp.]HPP70050.1 S8 family serine peptidase [Pseudothermotoga sp.]
MKRLIIVLVLSVVLLLAGCMNNSVQNSQQPEDIVAAIDKGAEVMSNVVIVGYKDGYKQDIVNLIKSIDENATVRVDFKLDQTNVISFSTSIDYSTMREKIINKLKSDETLKEKINYVEPSYRRYLIEPITNNSWKDSEIASKAKIAYVDQQEEFFEKYMWGIRKVKAPEAWELGYTGKGVIVAVVDTGVDGTHPDLQGQLVEGYRPLTDETLPAASDSSFGGAHGTHVAGTIAASDNSIGVVGVAPDAKIMPIVIFDTG